MAGPAVTTEVSQPEIQAERPCENCGRPYQWDGNPYTLTCSVRCSRNSRTRRRELLGGRPQPLRRRFHVRPVEPVTLPGRRRWLAATWPAYRRRLERNARLVWIDLSDLTRDRWTHHPPERCQCCDVPVRVSTRATRTRRWLVFCTPEHLDHTRPPAPTPLEPVCPRPDKPGMYETRDEAVRANARLFQQRPLLDAYECACTWWHVGKRRDPSMTIAARARITRAQDED